MAQNSCATITQTFSSYGACDTSNGGVATFYLTNLENVTGLTMSSGYTITSIGMSAGTKFYEYKPYQFRGLADMDGTKTEFGGTKFDGKVTLELLGLTTESIQRAKKINKSIMGVIVKYNSGKYFAWGWSESDLAAPTLANGVVSTACNFKGGQKSEDFNGCELNLVWNASSPMIEVDPSILTPIVVTA